MSANLEAKKQIVEEIKDKLSRSKSVTFVDYNALTVAEDTEMRRNFKKNGAEYKVYKNKLLLLALNELGIKGAEEFLHGASAVAFSYDDEVSGAKIACETAKKTKKLTVKFGLLNGNFVDSKEIEDLAKLPSKEVLVAKLLGTLNAPVSALARVLSAPVQGLAIALNAIASK